MASVLLAQLRKSSRWRRRPGGRAERSNDGAFDAIAVGYVFPTDLSDAAFGAVPDDLALGGYAYLLICRGRATLATCMFDDFHNDKQCLERTVQFFEKAVGVTPRDARSFGGFGNMSAEPTVRRGKLLLAGEAAGLQDALFGFGMRYALGSGHFAGRAAVDDDLLGYETVYRRRFRPWIQAAAVNRYIVPARRSQWVSDGGHAGVRREGPASVAPAVLQRSLVDIARVSPRSRAGGTPPGGRNHPRVPRGLRLHVLPMRARGHRPGRCR